MAFVLKLLGLLAFIAVIAWGRRNDSLVEIVRVLGATVCLGLVVASGVQLPLHRR